MVAMCRRGAWYPSEGVLTGRNLHEICMKVRSDITSRSKKEQVKNGEKKEKSAVGRLSRRVSAEPMLDGIQPNEQSLSYLLACCVIYMLSAEDVDLTVKEDFGRLRSVKLDVLDGLRRNWLNRIKFFPLVGGFVGIYVFSGT